MSALFAGKVAIVTGQTLPGPERKCPDAGSSNGIGRATAAAFARLGAKITVTGRNEKSIEVIVSSIRQQIFSLQETKAILQKEGCEKKDICEVCLLIGH